MRPVGKVPVSDRRALAASAMVQVKKGKYVLVLKVLNGPTCGAEIVLPGEPCFVRTVSTMESFAFISEDVREPDSPHSVITIPVNGEGMNFLIRRRDTGAPPQLGTDDDVAHDTPYVTECYGAQGGVEVRSLPLNTIVGIGALQVAIRHNYQRWSDTVRRGVAPPASAQPWWRTGAAGVAGGAVVVTLVALAWMLHAMLGRADSDEAVRAIAATEHGTVLSGKNHMLYVIAPGALEADRIKRALGRAASPARVEVHSARAEEARVRDALTQAGIGVFSVRTCDLRHPTVILRRDGVEPDVQAARRVAMRALPYVHGVKFVTRDAAEAREAARQLTRDLGVHASFERTPAHFTVHVDDHLSDADVQAMGTAMREFQQYWGDHYVRFVVDQREPLRFDGVRTGDGGYALLSTNHFSFPRQR